MTPEPASMRDVIQECERQFWQDYDRRMRDLEREKKSDSAEALRVIASFLSYIACRAARGRRLRRARPDLQVKSDFHASLWLSCYRAWYKMLTDYSWRRLIFVSRTFLD